LVGGKSNGIAETLFEFNEMKAVFIAKHDIGQA